LEDGEFRTKDQLRDYHFRGLELENLGFLQFLLRTRDDALEIRTRAKRQKTDNNDPASTSTSGNVQELSDNEFDDDMNDEENIQDEYANNESDADATVYGLNGETVVRSFDSGASGQNTENRDNHKTQNNS
jgi:hypothetical protein